MSNYYAATYSADGSESSKSLNEAMAEQPEAPSQSESLYREGGVVYKTQADGEGTITQTVTRRGPAEKPVESSDPLDNAVLNGSRVPRGRLTEAAMLDDPRLGGSLPISQAIDLGWLRKDANGVYKWCGDMAALGTAPSPAEAEATAKAADGEAVIPSDAGTATTTDITKRMLTKGAGPMVASAITLATIKGQDVAPFVAEISRRTGQPEAEIKQAVDSVTADYTRSARRIAVANGLRDSDASWAGLISWASEANPEAAQNAFVAFADNHDAGPFIRLVRQYHRSGQAESAYSDAEILAANFGSGIRAVKTASGVELDIPNHGRMSLKQAIARGIVRVSK